MQKYNKFPIRDCMIQKLVGALDPMMDEFRSASKEIGAQDNEELLRRAMNLSKVDAEGTDYDVQFEPEQHFIYA